MPGTAVTPARGTRPRATRASAAPRGARVVVFFVLSGGGGQSYRESFELAFRYRECFVGRRVVGWRFVLATDPV